MNGNANQISKFLSYVLRHRPDSIGLELSPEGWVSVEALLTAATKNGQTLSRSQLEDVVFTNDKQRFSFSPDGTQIRANQGHSARGVDLNFDVVEPPLCLYHGTVERFIESIRESGLLKKNRHHVHLSAAVETASHVGARRGKAIVLGVRALDMHRAGYRFFLSANGVWLTDHVPVCYIELPFG